MDISHLCSRVYIISGWIVIPMRSQRGGIQSRSVSKNPPNPPLGKGGNTLTSQPFVRGGQGGF